MLHDKLWLTIAAWLGTAVVVGVIAGLAYAVADSRVPRIRKGGKR